MLHGIEVAAKRLGLANSTVRRGIALGRIPTVRIGRRVLLADEVLDRLEREGFSGSLTKAG